MDCNEKQKFDKVWNDGLDSIIAYPLTSDEHKEIFKEAMVLQDKKLEMEKAEAEVELKRQELALKERDADLKDKELKQNKRLKIGELIIGGLGLLTPFILCKIRHEQKKELINGTCKWENEGNTPTTSAGREVMHDIFKD